GAVRLVSWSFLGTAIVLRSAIVVGVAEPRFTCPTVESVPILTGQRSPLHCAKAGCDHRIALDIAIILRKRNLFISAERKRRPAGSRPSLVTGVLSKHLQSE